MSSVLSYVALCEDSYERGFRHRRRRHLEGRTGGTSGHSVQLERLVVGAYCPGSHRSQKSACESKRGESVQRNRTRRSSSSIKMPQHPPMIVHAARPTRRSEHLHLCHMRTCTVVLKRGKKAVGFHTRERKTQDWIPLPHWHKVRVSSFSFEASSSSSLSCHHHHLRGPPASALR